MKTKSPVLIFAIAAALAAPLPAQATAPGGSGPYLGQTFLETGPTKLNLAASQGYFASERIALAPDGKEIYYSELNGWKGFDREDARCRIKAYRWTAAGWSGPELTFEGFHSPALSADGTTLYFEDFEKKAWSSRKKGGVWQPPVPFDGPAETHYLQPTDSGHFYALTEPEEGAGGQDWCRLVSPGGTGPWVAKSLGSPPNTPKNESDYFMARDEAYLIVALETPKGRALAVSFPAKDGTWTVPVKFPREVNASQWNWGPVVSPDRQVLFFSSGTSPRTYAVYGVRIDRIIEAMRPH